MGCQVCADKSSLDEESRKFQEPLIKVNTSGFVLFKKTPFVNDYEIGDLLEIGTSGIVHQVRHRTSGMMRVMKQIVNFRDGSSRLLEEVNQFSSIDHPHVMKIFEFYEDPGHFYIVSELLEGGNLLTYIEDHIKNPGNISESLVAAIMSQLFSAVKCCHEAGIIYRNLNPENIMLENEPTSASDLHLKLNAFGSSVLSTGDPLNIIIGTAYYIAPEVLAGAYDMKCDIWSLGVILYVLLSGVPPFNGRSYEEISDNIRKGEYSLTSKEWETVSHEAKELVKKLLVLDPADRISLADAMVDPWLSLDERSRKFPETRIKVNPSRFVSFKKTPFVNDYEIGGLLGNGSSGIVYKVRHRTSGMMRVMKQIAYFRDGSSRLLQELNQLSSIDHPHVMKIFEFYEDPGHFYIVSELLKGGYLFTYIQNYIEKTGNIPESLVAEIMSQLFSAVKCCHEAGIIHRNLKPENIMLQTYPTSVSDLHLKIIGFDASVLYLGERLSEKIETAEYMAPEMVEGNYDKRCDIWNLGVILYFLFVGKTPFRGQSVEEVSKQICIGKVSFSSEIWTNVSDGAKELLNKLLVVDPNQRISIEEALNDPWIKSHGLNRSVVVPAASEVLLNFKQFQGEQKLRQALSAYAVVHFSSADVLARQQDLFKALDTDSSGNLTQAELEAGLSTQMSPKEAQSEADRIMKMIDMNHNGAVELTEFQTSTAFVQEDVTLEQLKAAFESLDVDQNGKLSCEELKSVLGRGVAGAEDWRKLLAQADTNEDGEIDWNEFISFLITQRKPR